jgi:HK97 family phage prohead protease
MLVHVERPAGTAAQWLDSDGSTQETIWFVDYGYFPNKLSVDGDSLDAFVGWHEDAQNAYVIDQRKDGKPDQPKVMLAFGSANEARAVFEAHRWPGAFGGMRQLAVEELRTQLDNWTGTLIAEPIEQQETKMPPNAKQGFSTLVKCLAVAALATGTLAPEVRDAILPFTRESNGPDATATRQDGVHVRTIHVREVREDAREVDFVASTETIDSYGEIVKQNWLLDRYMRNPVVLFAHDSHSLPIGHATKVAVEMGALHITVKFSTARANPFAELCFQSVLEKALRGGSVGFKPHTIRYEMVNNKEICVLDQNELYEFSVCPVPSNPDGLAQLESRMSNLIKSFSAATTAAKPKQEGRMPKKTIGDAEATELRTRGSCKVTCDCGGEMEIEMPMLVKMDEATKAAAEELATLKRSIAEEQQKAATEKRKTEVKVELDALVRDNKLLVDDVDDLVELALEKPERYAAKVGKIRERSPLNAPDMTKRPDLGGEPSHQRGSAAAPPAPDDVLLSMAANVPMNSSAEALLLG